MKENAALFPSLMRMPVLHMVGLSHVSHAADRALTGLLATAVFAVHGADVGGGVFLALAVRAVRSGARGGLVVVIGMIVIGVLVCFIVTVVGLFRSAAAAGNGKKSRAEKQGQNAE